MCLWDKCHIVVPEHAHYSELNLPLYQTKHSISNSEAAINEHWTNIRVEV